MTSYSIQAGALRTNPKSGPDGVGVQADIAYTLEARAEVQAVCGTPANDNRPVAVPSNAAATEKRCSMCEVVKPLDAFHKQPTGKHGRLSYCAECANAIRTLTRPTTSAERGYLPEQKKRWNLKRRYGMTPADYESILASQNGECAMCGEYPQRPCVDHNHETGQVRGILCHRCNIGLPYVEDETFRRRAIAYLNQHQARAA